MQLAVEKTSDRDMHRSEESGYQSSNQQRKYFKYTPATLLLLTFVVTKRNKKAGDRNINKLFFLLSVAKESILVTDYLTYFFFITTLLCNSIINLSDGTKKIMEFGLNIYSF